MKHISVDYNDEEDKFLIYRPDVEIRVSDLAQLIDALKGVRLGYDDDSEVTFEHDAFARFLELVEAKCMKSKEMV